MSSDTIGLSAYIGACRRSRVDCILEFMTALSNGSREVILTNRSIPLTDQDLLCMCEALITNVNLKVLDIEGNRLTCASLPHLLNVMTQNPILRELRIGGNQIGNEGSNLICGGILSTGLRVLDLCGSELNGRGIDSLCSAISNSKCLLAELSLHNNKIDEDAVRMLCAALRSNEKLKHVHLGTNPIGLGGAAYISELISQPRCVLQSLDLSCCSLGSKGVDYICRAVVGNKSLQYLNLRNNGIDDQGITHVVKMIRVNNTLRKLYVGGNPINSSTTALLLKSIANNQGLVLFDVSGCPVDVQNGGLASICEVLQYNATLHNLFVEDIVGGRDAEEQIERALTERKQRGMPGIFVGKEEYKDATSVARSSASMAGGGYTSDNAPTTQTNRSQINNNNSINNSTNTSAVVVSSSNVNSPPRTQRSMVVDDTTPAGPSNRAPVPTALGNSSLTQGPYTPPYPELLSALQMVDHTNSALLKDRLLTAFVRVINDMETIKKDQDLKIARLTARVAELEAMHNGSAVHTPPFSSDSNALAFITRSSGNPIPTEKALPSVLLSEDSTSPQRSSPNRYSRNLTSSSAQRASNVVSPIRMYDNYQNTPMVDNAASGRRSTTALPQQGGSTMDSTPATEIIRVPAPSFVPVANTNANSNNNNNNNPLNLSRPASPKKDTSSTTVSPVPPAMVDAFGAAPRLTPLPLGHKSTPHNLGNCPNKQDLPRRAHGGVSPRVK
eukprot:PhF_6_TR11521/c1_g1_i2/m.18452